MSETSEPNQSIAEKAVRNKIKVEDRISLLREEWEKKTGKKYTELKPSKIENEVFYREEIEKLGGCTDKGCPIVLPYSEEKLEELRGEYKTAFGKDVANSMKTNGAWMEQKIKEFLETK